MGTIQVPGKFSGRTYNLKIKGDTPSPTEQERIRAFLEQKENDFAAQYAARYGAPLSTEDGTALGRGFQRGKENVRSTLGTTLETIGQQTGIASLANYGRGMEQNAENRLFGLSLTQPAPTTRQDVANAEGLFDTIDKSLSYAGEVAGEQGPQLGAALVGGAAGAGVGFFAGGPPGAVAGFGIGSGLTEAPMLFGSNVQRQEAEVAAGRRDRVDLGAALGATVGQAALTGITNSLAGSGIFLRPGAKMFTRVATGAAIGGSAESLNEVGQQVLERYQAGLPIDSPEAIQEYIDAGIAGGILGVGAGGVGGVFGRGAEAGTETPPPGETVPQIGKETAPPGLPSPPKAGVANIVSIEETVVGGRNVTEVTLSDGTTLTLGEGATSFDVAKAVDQHNQGKAVAGKPATKAQVTPKPTPKEGVNVDMELADARAIYDERLAIAEEGGADPVEAQKIAAAAAVNYVDGLRDDVKSRLARFRNTMARLAARSTAADIRPPLPDEAYAEEFGQKVQGELNLGDQQGATQEIVAPKMEQPAQDADLKLADEVAAATRAAKEAAPEATDLPRVEIKGAEWLKENVNMARDLADRRAITGKIEDLFAQGLTAGQVRIRLNADGDLKGIPPEDTAGFVASVRASLGIPSQMAEEGKAEFQDWLKDYQQRKQAKPKAPETALPVTPPAPVVSETAVDETIVTPNEVVLEETAVEDVSPNLAAMTQEELATHYETAGLPEGVKSYDALTARPEFRGLSQAARADIFLKNKAAVEKYTSTMNALRVNDIDGVKQKVTSSGWEHFVVGKDSRSDGDRYKSYVTLRDMLSLSEADVRAVLTALRDAGYNGQIKFPSTGSRALLAFDNIVMHGATEADAKLGQQVVLSYFGDRASSSQLGVDRNGKSHTEAMANALDAALKGEKKDVVGKSAPAPKPVTAPVAEPRAPGMPEKVSVGPGAIKTKPIGGTLYSDMSVEALNRLLRELLIGSNTNGIVAARWFSDNRDLALGQGVNTGVIVEFDGRYVSGSESQSKPGLAAGVVEGREFKSDFIHDNAVRSFTLSPTQKLPASTLALVKKAFNETVAEDGSRSYSRGEAVQESGPAATTGGNNVSETAELEPKAVGTRPADGGPRVENGGDELSDVSATEDVAASDEGRLGGDLPVPSDTADTTGDRADTLAALRETLAAARARAAELRKKVPAGILQRELIWGQVDPKLAQRVKTLTNKVAKEKAEADTAKAAIPQKPTHPARPKKLAAYQAALDKLRATEQQLAEAEDTLSAAELAVAIRRKADTKKPMTDKAETAYTAYYNALQDADTIRQALESELNRAAKAVPDAPQVPTNLNEPVIPDAWTTARRGDAGFTVPSQATPPSPAYSASTAQVDALLQKRFDREASDGVKRGAKFLNEPGNKWTTPDKFALLDKQKVLSLLFTSDKVLSPQAAAAKLYFSKVARPIDALLMIVDDLTVGYDKYRANLGTPAWQAEFMNQTGETQAKLALEYIRTALSPQVNAEADFLIELSEKAEENQALWTADENRVDAARTKRKEARGKAKEAAKESGYGDIGSAMAAVLKDPLAALDRTLHYSVKSALDNGDLKGALLALAETSPSPEVRALAKKFAELTGTTRVKVLYPGDSARNIGSNRGIFWQSQNNPERQNIIYLNGQTGMDAHVLLHEMAHAVTANLVDVQPNHPVVKQLQQLLESVRANTAPPGLYGYEYSLQGLQNVKEFIADAYGRVAFGETDNGLRDLMKRTEFKNYSYEKEDLPLTNWERFKEIIGNFFRSLLGRPSKPYPRRTKTKTIVTTESGLDRFHRLVDGLLSEAPQVLPSQVLQKSISNPLIGITTLNNAIRNAPVWDKASRARLSNQMQASMPNGARRFLLGLLQLDWFNDLAGEYFPQIARLKELDDLRRGEIVRSSDEVKPVLQDLIAYAEKSPELYAKLMALQGRATLEEVDPTKPQSAYGGDQDKLRIWHELNRELKTADGSGEMVRLFKKVRNVYHSYRLKIRDSLIERVKDITDDVAMQNQLVARLMAKLDEEGAIDPFFSLMREGDFWLAYTAEDTTGEYVSVDPDGTPRRPTARFVQAFNSVWERQQFIDKLRATKDKNGKDVAWDMEEFMRPLSEWQDKSVPTPFAQGAINIVRSLVPKNANAMEQRQVDEAIAAIQDLFVRFTPENSLLQSFRKRKGTRGFIGDITPLGVVDRTSDMVNVFAKKTSSLNYQIANLKYGAKIQKLRNNAKATYNRLNASPALTPAEKTAVRAYYEEFDDRAKFAQSPHVSGAAQMARGITFGMTLGFNIAGAANNLMQIPMIGFTELMGRYNARGAMRELGSATKLLMNAGKTHKVVSFGPDGRQQRTLSDADNFGSIANYFEVGEDGAYRLRSDKKIPKALRAKLSDMDTLVEVLSANGMLANSMAQEMLDADSGWLHKINRWSGFLMHHAERFNRQAMAIAAYNLELESARAGGGVITDEIKLAAAKKAVEITERVNGSIGASTASRLAQSALGSVVFMFKRFGLTMARYIIGTANQALRGATKEDRRVARYQIIGMLGTTALFAGVQGLPFLQELMSIFDLLFTDDDEEPAEVVLQKYLQEPFYHGAINYLTGAEVASRISMGGLIFRENKIDKDQSSLYDLIEMFGGPAVGVYMNVERGVDLLSQGELYRGVEAMMPSAIKSGLKSVRYATEGATTLRGDEVVPMSPTDIALQFLGYTPAAYARTQERVSAEKRIDEAIRNKKRKLYREYYLAYLDGDFEAMRDVRVRMGEFSRENPNDAITDETLNRSLNANIKRSKEMIGGVSFSPAYRGRAETSINDEYDQDLTLWGS